MAAHERQHRHRSGQRAARLHRRAPAATEAVREPDAARPADRELAALLAVRVERRARGSRRPLVTVPVARPRRLGDAKRGMRLQRHRRSRSRRAGRAHPPPTARKRTRVAEFGMAADCALSLVGLIVLLQLNFPAGIAALVSIAPVAAYPFMKRITWWPQAWLGIVFSWGALVGWPAATGSFSPTTFLLWFGSIAWVVGYDTLYAIQDIEDDSLVGVKSSARRLGERRRLESPSSTVWPSSSGVRPYGPFDRIGWRSSHCSRCAPNGKPGAACRAG